MTYTIEQIKELLEELDWGPWEIRESNNIVSVISRYLNTVAIITLGNKHADFIAASRTIIPELVAEVEKLRKVLLDIVNLKSVIIDDVVAHARRSLEL